MLRRRMSKRSGSGHLRGSRFAAARSRRTFWPSPELRAADLDLACRRPEEGLRGCAVAHDFAERAAQERRLLAQDPPLLGVRRERVDRGVQARDRRVEPRRRASSGRAGPASFSLSSPLSTSS